MRRRVTDLPPPSAGPAPDTISLGPMRVRANSKDIIEFAAALGLEQNRADKTLIIPATFPFWWMFRAPVQDWVRMVLHPAIGIIHRTQEIAYITAIKPDAAYDLSVDVDRATAVPQVIISGLVVDLSGSLICTLVSKVLVVNQPAG